MLLAVLDVETVKQLTVDGFFRGCSYGLLGAGFALILGVTGRFHFAYAFTYTFAVYMAYQFTFPPGAAVLAVGHPRRAACRPRSVCSSSGSSTDPSPPTPAPTRCSPSSSRPSASASPGRTSSASTGAPKPSRTTGPTRWPYTVWDTTFINFDVWQAASAIVLVVALALTLRYTALGRQIKATRVNPELARIIGINANTIYLIVLLHRLGVRRRGRHLVRPEVHGRPGHGLQPRDLRLRRGLPRRHGPLADPGVHHRHHRRPDRAVLLDLAVGPVDADGGVRRARALPDLPRGAIQRRVVQDPPTRTACVDDRRARDVFESKNETV